MIGERLRMLRLSRALSLEALAVEMGGMVTKQALSKYERGKATPSPVVLVKLAAALGVKAVYLMSRPRVNVEFVAYRIRMRLPKKEQARIEAVLAEALEDRVRLQELVGQRDGSVIPMRKLRAEGTQDVENAAEELRAQWKLGVGPIGSVVATLEEHFVCVLQMDAADRFDGVSAVAYDDERNVKAAAVLTRSGIPGERQRLNLVHELGHLVLDVPQDGDEEKAAFRFGGAFLAPADRLFQEVGRKRAFIPLDEVLLLKKQLGMSVQALLYRLRDLGVITESYYRQWCIDINRLGWKRNEPLELPSEEPSWQRRNVLRLLAEGVLSADEAARMLRKGPVSLRGPQGAAPGISGLAERRAFMKLPLETRRQVLREQAEMLAGEYERDREREDIQGGDIVEY
ncbi:MAG: helix-turn-helix domain-containing protein [Chloroflexi bacterium]|nr:helix-turn-helix domain-containing protein [Chloroflexota bacterium]